MYSQNESVTIRLDQELYEWLKQTAVIKNCKISDLIRESIVKMKKYQNVPNDMQFSDLLDIHAAKASVMTYRLLEKFIRTTQEQGDAIIVAAGNICLKEISNWKIDPANNKLCHPGTSFSII